MTRPICYISGCGVRKEKRKGKVVVGFGWCCDQHKKIVWSGVRTAPSVPLSARNIVEGDNINKGRNDVVNTINADTENIIRKERVAERERKVALREADVKRREEAVLTAENNITDVIGKYISERNSARKERDGLVRKFIDSLESSVGAVCYNFYDPRNATGYIMRKDVYMSELKAREEALDVESARLKKEREKADSISDQLREKQAVLAQTQREISELRVECESLMQIVRVGSKRKEILSGEHARLQKRLATERSKVSQLRKENCDTIRRWKRERGSANGELMRKTMALRRQVGLKERMRVDYHQKIKILQQGLANTYDDEADESVSEDKGVMIAGHKVPDELCCDKVPDDDMLQVFDNSAAVNWVATFGLPRSPWKIEAVELCLQLLSLHMTATATSNAIRYFMARTYPEHREILPGKPGGDYRIPGPSIIKEWGEALYPMLVSYNRSIIDEAKIIYVGHDASPRNKLDYFATMATVVDKNGVRNKIPLRMDIPACATHASEAQCVEEAVGQNNLHKIVAINQDNAAVGVAGLVFQSKEKAVSELRAADPGPLTKQQSMIYNTNFISRCVDHCLELAHAHHLKEEMSVLRSFYIEHNAAHFLQGVLMKWYLRRNLRRKYLFGKICNRWVITHAFSTRSRYLCGGNVLCPTGAGSKKFVLVDDSEISNVWESLIAMSKLVSDRGEHSNYFLNERKCLLSYWARYTSQFGNNDDSLEGGLPAYKHSRFNIQQELAYYMVGIFRMSVRYISEIRWSDPNAEPNRLIRCAMKLTGIAEESAMLARAVYFGVLSQPARLIFKSQSMVTKENRNDVLSMFSEAIRELPKLSSPDIFVSNVLEKYPGWHSLRSIWNGDWFERRLFVWNRATSPEYRRYVRRFLESGVVSAVTNIAKNSEDDITDSKGEVVECLKDACISNCDIESMFGVHSYAYQVSGAQHNRLRGQTLATTGHACETEAMLYMRRRKRFAKEVKKGNTTWEEWKPDEACTHAPLTCFFNKDIVPISRRRELIRQAIKGNKETLETYRNAVRNQDANRLVRKEKLQEKEMKKQSAMLSRYLKFSSMERIVSYERMVEIISEVEDGKQFSDPIKCDMVRDQIRIRLYVDRLRLLDGNVKVSVHSAIPANQQLSVLLQHFQLIVQHQSRHGIPAPTPPLVVAQRPSLPGGTSFSLTLDNEQRLKAQELTDDFFRNYAGGEFVACVYKKTVPCDAVSPECVVGLEFDKVFERYRDEPYRGIVESFNPRSRRWLVRYAEDGDSEEFNRQELFRFVPRSREILSQTVSQSPRGSNRDDCINPYPLEEPTNDLETLSERSECEAWLHLLRRSHMQSILRGDCGSETWVRPTRRGFDSNSEDKSWRLIAIIYCMVTSTYYATYGPADSAVYCSYDDDSCTAYNYLLELESKREAVLAATSLDLEVAPLNQVLKWIELSKKIRDEAHSLEILDSMGLSSNGTHVRRSNRRR